MKHRGDYHVLVTARFGLNKLLMASKKLVRTQVMVQGGSWFN